jgi:hypothetical protein
MSRENNWQELLTQPKLGDHLVQVYQDFSFLCDTVGEYLAASLSRGEAGIVIAVAEHHAGFERALLAKGVDVERAKREGQLRILDGHETLASFTVDGKPEWQAFHRVVGGAIAELRLQYPVVRAYGEMVDVLWQRGERDAAILLEGYWNELARLQTFSLLCAYYMDNLDPATYRGALQCICDAHTHLIPARDYEHFDRAVHEASRQVLDEPRANMMLALAANERPRIEMPLGQAALLWLQENMPRTAEKVLSTLRARA